MPSTYDFEATFADALDAVPAAHRDAATFVPGSGPLDAPVMVVGEAPGAEAVKRRTPLVDTAGRRLDTYLLRVGLDRSDCYLTYAVKVRSSTGGEPAAETVAAWRPVLTAELERVNPAVVVTLDDVATRAVLDTDEGISELRGQRVERDGRLVVPTFHPAATVYDETAAPAIEEDLESVTDELRRRA